MIKSRLIVALCAAFVVSNALAAPRIEQLAPQDSAVVGSIENWESLERSARATSLWKLWEAPELKDVRQELIEEYENALKEAMRELGMADDEELPRPSGHVGFAMFPVMNEELGTNEPGMLFIADYGQGADQVFKLVDAALKKGEKDGELSYEEKDIRGRKVNVITVKDEEPLRVIEVGGEDMEEGDQMIEPPAPHEMMKSFGTMCLVREGSWIILCSNQDRLTDTLETLDGQGDHKGIATHETHQRLAGKTAGTDAHAVFIMENFKKMLSAEAGAGMAMFEGAMDAAFGRIDGGAMAFKLNEAPNMVDMRWHVSMPHGKGALTSLMDTATPKAVPPDFVTGNVMSYSRFNFEYQGLVEAIQSVIKATPMAADMDEATMMEMEQTIGQLTADLKPETHTVATVTRPLTLDGVGSLWAIRCEKFDSIKAFIDQHVEMMGIERREVLGHTMYTLNEDMMGMMMPFPMAGGAGGGFSLAHGGGFLFAGITGAVEQALRSTGDKQTTGGAASDPELKHAIAAVPEGDHVGWGFLNLVDQIDMVRQSVKLQQEEMIRQWREFDPEEADRMAKELAEQEPTGFEKLDATVLKRYLGLLTWVMDSDDESFSGRVMLLEPTGN